MSQGEARSNFDLRALYDAIDREREARGMTWTDVARGVNQHVTILRPIAVSTITGLKTKPAGEGDGVLQMLLWVGRTPESFVPGFARPDDERFRLRRPSRGQILRWDTKALHAALDSRRRARKITWTEAAREIGGRVTSNTLTNLANGGRTGFPQVMRIVQWLERPAAEFTRVAAW
jgi:hypothetical protein